MMAQTATGRYFLKDGVQLLPEPSGALILQSSPLRGIRVNRAAMGILDKCRSGFTLNEAGAEGGLDAEISLCDTLCDAGILDWVPPKDGYEPAVSIVIPV